MITIAVISAVILVLLALPITTVDAALRRSEAHSELAEAWAFLRLLVFSLFALVVGQALAPVGYLWWVNVLLAIAITLATVILTQLGSKWLNRTKVGATLMLGLQPLIRQVNFLFTPLSGPIAEKPEEFEQELIESVEDFTETIAREIMVPRIDMVSVTAETDLAAAMSVFLGRGFSRLPVLGKSVDDVVGVLYLKDVARVGYEQPAQLSVGNAATLMRQAIFVPESKPVDDLLKQMQTSSVHMAIVVDEYGGVAGLVTMEDVIEEIVGEISDEYDREVPDVVQLGEGRFLVNARYSLTDLGELFELELETEMVDSVGGLVAMELGQLPKLGDSVRFSGLTFTVDRIEPKRKRLITLTVERTPEADSAIDSFSEEKS